MPDLLRLLVSEMGERPPPPDSSDRARYDEQALHVAVAGRLPLRPVADALGQPVSAAWRDALAEEQRRAEVRQETLDALAAALGAERSPVTAALGAPAWRPLSGSDVDLLAPDVIGLAERLAQSGFLPVPAHDEPQRRVLLRCAGGRAVDLVDLETVSPDQLEPAGSGSAPGTVDRWGRLTREAAVRRFHRRLAERGRARLVDRADAEELGLAEDFGLAEELAPVVELPLNDEPEPGGATVPPQPADPIPPRVRVVLTGAGAPQEAERLAESVRVAALDVVVARSPSALPRALVRHVRDRAVLVVCGRLPLPGAVVTEVPGPGLSESGRLELLRRTLTAGRR